MQFALLALLLSVVAALRFDLEASPKGTLRCIRDFVGSETLVVVKVNTNGRANDGQKLTLAITDSQGNRYAYRENILDRSHQTFSPSADTSFDVCFTNTLVQGTGSKKREIELEVEIGAYARDWASYQASEKLKPTEVKLRQLNDKVEELYNDLEYMRLREERLRDTNESTNRRVKNFSLLVLLSFFGLGAWQITYLRTYFRSKHII